MVSDMDVVYAEQTVTFSIYNTLYFNTHTNYLRVNYQICIVELQITFLFFAFICPALIL